MGDGNLGDTVDYLHIFSEQETVASYDFLCLRIPDYHLLARTLHGVEFVDVAFLSGASSAVAEGDFAQTSDFAHCVGRIECIDNVDFVVALVCGAEETFRGQFLEDELGINFFDYGLHDILLLLGVGGSEPVESAWPKAK